MEPTNQPTNSLEHVPFTQKKGGFSPCPPFSSAKVQPLSQILRIAVRVENHAIRAAQAATDVHCSNLIFTFGLQVQEVLGTCHKKAMGPLFRFGFAKGPVDRMIEPYGLPNIEKLYKHSSRCMAICVYP